MKPTNPHLIHDLLEASLTVVLGTLNMEASTVGMFGMVIGTGKWLADQALGAGSPCVTVIITLLNVLCSRCSPTLHIEQLVLGGDLRGSLGHSLAVEDPLMLFAGVLQDKSLGGVVGH